MSWLWDTIAGRTILILVGGLLFSLVLGQQLYQRGLERELREGNASRLADRLIVLKQTITRLPVDQRDDAAHTLAGGPIDLHWSLAPLAVATDNLDATAERLRETLRERVPELKDHGLIIGISQDTAAPRHPGNPHGGDHVTVVSMVLPDGSWLNMSLAQVAQGSVAGPSLLATALLLSVAVAVLAILMGRWLTRPLIVVADGARQLFAGADPAYVPVGGTREVRDLAVAFNDMQARIKRLIDDRTNMLAAVSHDMRTPLTRLRLRAEAIGDEESRTSMVRDLDEMDAMLNSTLSFLRGDRSDEPIQPLDLGAILQSIVNDCEDRGFAVALNRPRNLLLAGRPLALKRAFTNLIDNAIRHGHHAEIDAQVEAGVIRVVVCDSGPGIPPDQLEHVFAPYVRLGSADVSANPGYGLGLTVARSLIRMHGGDVRLNNRPEGGLSAIVILPQHPQRPR